MKTNMKRNSLGLSGLVLGTLLAGSCVTTQEVAAQQQPQPIVQEATTEQEANVVTLMTQDQLIQYLYPGLETNLALDIPEQFQDENGLFVLVDKNSPYFKESWNRGYAGMFTEEDLAGRSIGGYEISLPMQIFGNWSADDVDYFERVQHPRVDRLDTSVNLYYNDLRLKNPALNEVSPYFELDKAYADMIKADDSLTPDEQLELIIMNHKGYLENLLPNIRGIIEENYDLDSPERIHTALFNGYSFDLHDDIVVGVFHSMIDDEYVNGFLVNSFASLKILEYRFPQIYEDHIIGDIGREIIYYPQESSYAGSSRKISDQLLSIRLYPSLAGFSYEKFLDTFTHEIIHSSIKEGNTALFNSELISWLNNPSRNSEFVTYVNSNFLCEVLNYSLSGYTTATNSNKWFYGYGDRYFGGEAPLEHFVRLIDNTDLQ